MRVRFLKAYGEHQRGAVIDLDEGAAADLIELAIVRETPRTPAELAEAATKYYPGDEARTAKQIADRVAQLAPPPEPEPESKPERRR